MAGKQILFYFKLTIVIAFLVVAYVQTSQADIVVNTPSGPVRGLSLTRDHETVWQFRKIPYAKPPVGDLRFAKPEPYGKWTGTLDGTNYGASCMQVLPAEATKVLPNKKLSEDCLFLNVYVPRNVSRLNSLTVMTWIHGGGYQTGEGMLYQPDYLSLRGNVIVVTINYRLNVFGFLSAGDSVMPGNYGLWDQRLAIQWVKSNIAAFGGNPSSMTIFGESAGGWSVGLQSLYPENKGLFSRAIMESGVGNSLMALSINCVNASKGIGAYLQCSPSDPNAYAICLRKASASAILQAALKYGNATFNKTLLHFGLDFAPVVDNDFIKGDPSKLLTNVTSPSYQFFRSLDVIIGNMNAEGSLLIGSYFKLYEQAYSFNVKDGIPNKFFCELITSSVAIDYYHGKSVVAKAICDKYSASDKSDLVSQARLAVDMYGDAFFVSPAVAALNAHAKDNSLTKTFQFMFTHQPAFWLLGLPKWFQGAGHSSEIPYLFDIQTYAPFDPYITAADLKLSETMLIYWSNFAKTGNPGSTSVSEWREYGDDSVYIDLDYNITDKTQVFADRMKFWLHDLPNIVKYSNTVLKYKSLWNENEKWNGVK